MDCIVHGVTKNQTQLSNFHFHQSPYTQEFWGLGCNLSSERLSCGRWLVTLEVWDHLKLVNDLGYLKLGFYPCEVWYLSIQFTLTLGLASQEPQPKLWAFIRFSIFGRPCTPLFFIYSLLKAHLNFSSS